MNIRVICIVTGLTTGCYSVKAQNQDSFLLKGKIEGVPDGTMIVLKKGTDTLARGTSRGDQFELSGRIDGDANYYFLSMDSNVTKRSSEALWLINGKMEATGSLTAWPSVTLEGSTPQQEYKEMKRVHEAGINAGKEIPALKEFINTHLNSLYISDLIIKISSFYRKGELDTLFSNLSPEAQNSFYGQKLSERIKKETKVGLTMKKVAETSRLPNFKFKDSLGNVKHLLDYASQSKYTLIDFWASWCKPCRASVPELKEVYQKFRPHGFNIIGISIDKNDQSWKKALKEDNTSWNHVIDNVEAVTVDQLGFAAVPAYILIDSTGKILRTQYIQSSSKMALINRGQLTQPHLENYLNELLGTKL